MFERYTEEARRGLFFSRYEAFQLGSPTVETEHVLLGLCREPQSLVGRLFARAHLSTDEIRRQIEAHTGRHASISGPDEAPLGEETTRALRYAAQEAERLLHDYIGPEHILLGLFREEQGLAATILRESGLQIETVREAIVVAASASAGLPFRFPIGRGSPAAGAGHLRVSSSRRESRDGPLAVSTPQRISADGFTLKELIAWTYRADIREIELPDGLDDGQRYDARLDLSGPQGWPAIDRLIQEGLKTHFAITVTRETRPIEVFVLTAADGPSPGRRKHDHHEDMGGGVATSFTSFSTRALEMMPEPLPLEGPDWRKRLHSVGPIALTATTIEAFGHWLEEFVGHPVIDETGLRGVYDIAVEGEMQGFDELSQALLVQLALVLRRATRESELLVVRRRPH